MSDGSLMPPERRFALRESVHCGDLPPEVGELLDAVAVAHAEIARKSAKVRAITVERDRLREALELVEWNGYLDRDARGCSECDAIAHYDYRTRQQLGEHNRYCKVGIALNRHECVERNDGE